MRGAKRVGLIKRIFYSVVMKDLKKAETMFYDEFTHSSCEGCPEVCPINWDLCEIINLAGPLKTMREMGVIEK